MATRQAIARAVLDRYNQTFSEELSIHVDKNTPSPLFQLLCMSILFSARIGADIAAAAMRRLSEEGWTTSEKMADSTWSERAQVLNQSGYARYDERTSSMLGETAELVNEKYGGDLRELREEADRDPDRERELLKEFKGVGDVGVDIFFREVQVAWNELFPFADDRVLKSAKKLGLPADAKSLLRLVSKQDYPRLVSGLMRVQLAGEHKEIKESAEKQ